jgi:hypothetical protein
VVPEANYRQGSIVVTVFCQCLVCCSKIEHSTTISALDYLSQPHDVARQKLEKLREEMRDETDRRGWTAEMCGKCRDRA